MAAKMRNLSWLLLPIAAALGSLCLSILHLHSMDFSAVLPVHTTWEGDVWAAAGKRIYFDECDFNSVRVLKRFTFHTVERGEDAVLGMYGWRGGYVSGVEEREVDVDDLHISTTGLFDKDWSKLSEQWNSETFARWRAGEEPFWNFRLSCPEGNEPCDSIDGMHPLGASLFQSSESTWYSTQKASEFFENPPVFNKIRNTQRPYIVTAILWLDRRANGEPKECADKAPDRQRAFYLEAMTLQPSRSTISDEYTWDGQVCSMLFLAWILARMSGRRSLCPPHAIACDLYCFAYLLGVVAFIGLKAFVPWQALALLRLVAKGCAMGADVALVVGVAWERMPLLANDGGRLPYLPQVGLLSALMMAAILPSLRAQVPPGFFLCADGGDPLETSHQSDLLFLRLPAFVLALPCALSIWFYSGSSSSSETTPNGGDAETWPRPRAQFISAVMAFVGAPLLASAFNPILAGYVLRKVQLLTALALRTIAVYGLIATGFNADKNIIELAQIDGMHFSSKTKNEDSMSLPMSVAKKDDDLNDPPGSTSGSLEVPASNFSKMISVVLRALLPFLFFSLVAFAMSGWLSMSVDAQPRPEITHGKVTQVKLAKNIPPPVTKAPDPVVNTPPPPGQTAPVKVQGTCFTSDPSSLDPQKKNDQSKSTEGIKCLEKESQDKQDRLHIFYACDFQQLQGVQASIASVIDSSRNPEEITITIAVQEKQRVDFSKYFGVPTTCLCDNKNLGSSVGFCAVTPSGARLRIIGVGRERLQKALAVVPPATVSERGQIDSIENFARFYMHELLPDAKCLVYLDADTIVQEDLNTLRADLLASKKTIGFTARSPSVKMKAFVKNRKSCTKESDWGKELLESEAYNVGVLAVNLNRWREFGVTSRIERLVEQHNNCGGQLWIGGSQPPLLLAFLDPPAGSPRNDFTVFDAFWNAGDLGWRKDLSVEALVGKFVLHWNGKQKPWSSDGLYKELWKPYCQQFTELVTQVKTTTTSTDPMMANARQSCKFVELVDEWSQIDKDGKDKPCVIGLTFGCNKDGSMWTGGGCKGIFNVAGTHTWCGQAPDLPDDSEDVCAVRIPKKEVPQTTAAPPPAVTKPGLVFSMPQEHIFNGTQNCFMRKEGAAAALPINGEHYTIEAWVTPDKEIGHGTIVSWGEFGTRNGASGLRFDSDGQVMNYWWGNDLTAPVKSAVNGRYHHVAATWDGAVRKLMWDFREVGHDAPSGNDITDTSNFCIGAGYTKKENFQGKIKNVKIWTNAKSAKQMMHENIEEEASRLDHTSCKAGNMPQPSASCGAMLLTTYFTTKKDWQRLKHVEASFDKIKTLYRTSMKKGVNVTILYDNLPQNIVGKYHCKRFSFVKINFQDFSSRLGVNDVRYFFYNRLVKQHPEWKFIFLVDAFDVRVAMNPCHGVQQGTLYIGSEKEKLQGHPWMKTRFSKMGGKYENWYNNIGDKLHILNCGLIGGSREEMLRLFQHMMQVLLDERTTSWKNNETINLNMAALNYIMYNRYKSFATGMPLHSRYKMYEDERKDVWFVHK